MTAAAISDLARTLDAIVAACLCRAGIKRPPVDAFVLARNLGVDVLLDRGQQPRGRHAVVAGRAAIFVRPDDRLERQQWAVAHELGESLAHEADTGDLSSDAGGASREQLANLLASRLLLPAGWFFADARRLDQQLFRLKELYDTASHELIAWRLLDLDVASTVTVFDQGQPVRRRGNAALRPPPLTRHELDCWHEAHRFARIVDCTRDGVRVQAWPIHEPGWRREILHTAAIDEASPAD